MKKSELAPQKINVTPYNKGEKEQDNEEITMEMEDAENEQSKRDMPGVILKRILILIGLGLAAIVLSIGFIIIEKDVKYIVISALGVFLIVKAILFGKSFVDGKIEEKAMICVSVEKKLQSTRLSFRDAEDEHYEFYLAKDVHFLPSVTYILYLQNSQIVAWQAL